MQISVGKQKAFFLILNSICAAVSLHCLQRNKYTSRTCLIAAVNILAASLHCAPESIPLWQIPLCHSIYLSQWRVRKSLSPLSSSYSFEGAVSVECYGWPSTLVTQQLTLLFCAPHTRWLCQNHVLLPLSLGLREGTGASPCTLASSSILADEVDQGNAWRMLPAAGTGLPHDHLRSDRQMVPARNGKWTSQIN